MITKEYESQIIKNDVADDLVLTSLSQSYMDEYEKIEKARSTEKLSPVKIISSHLLIIV